MICDKHERLGRRDCRVCAGGYEFGGCMIDRQDGGCCWCEYPVPDDYRPKERWRILCGCDYAGWVNGSGEHACPWCGAKCTATKIVS